MEGQSSVWKQAKFRQRILCSKWRILRSPMLNEHPEPMANAVYCFYKTIIIVSGSNFAGVYQHDIP